MATPADDSNAPNELVSSRVLGTWLACSRAYISELEARGVLSRVKGKLPLRASVPPMSNTFVASGIKIRRLVLKLQLSTIA